MLTKVKFIMRMLGLLLVLGFVVFVVGGLTIGSQVKEMCEKAQQKYDRKCVEALIMFADDSENSFKDRNSAIWALGQLGNGKAKMLFEKYQITDVVPDKESLDGGISLYELKKANSLVSGEINISAWTWRWMIGV